jgi:hypothetical protein
MPVDGDGISPGIRRKPWRSARSEAVEAHLRRHGIVWRSLLLDVLLDAVSSVLPVEASHKRAVEAGTILEIAA